jgi:hypothetical protein
VPTGAPDLFGAPLDLTILHAALWLIAKEGAERAAPDAMTTKLRFIGRLKAERPPTDTSTNVSNARMRGAYLPPRRA